MRNLPQFAEAIVDKISKTITLESGIVVPVGIIVLVGIFVKINKHTCWSKRTGRNCHEKNISRKPIFKSLIQISILLALLIYISIKTLAN